MRAFCILFVTLSLAIGGCTSTDAGDEADPTTTTAPDPTTTTSMAPTTTTTTTSTTTAPAPTTTLPPGPEEPFPPDDLTANDWRVGIYVQTFSPDGTWSVRERLDDSSRFGGGTWELDGAMLTMVSEGPGATSCAVGRPARYWLEWSEA